MDSSHNKKMISMYIHDPAYSTGLTSSRQLVPITTDMDIFPYNRFFRGMATCTEPRFFDREAGHRPLRPDLYRPVPHPSPPPIPFKGCFQIPCSTILPCMPDTAFKQPIDFCVNTSP